ncbi:MAG: methyltransferase domain-containing protein [Candidatus Aenigmarchaeota archaeon]|nr:methyltransferase domain-containing protein [Candidatus Aenigmarchaeota archaeon]
MVLSLPAYLAAEGVRRISDSQLVEEEISILGIDKARELFRLLGNAQRPSSADFSAYAFQASNGVDHLFESAKYGENLTITEKVNRKLKGRKAILDAGCFTGLKTVWYALQNPESTVHGIDMVDESIQVAETRKAKYSAANASFSVQDVLTYKPDKKYDAVVLTNIVATITEAHNTRLSNPESAAFLRRRVAPLVSSWVMPHGMVIIYDRLSIPIFDEYRDMTQAAMLSEGFSKAGNERVHSSGINGDDIEGVFLAFQKP